MHRSVSDYETINKLFINNALAVSRIAESIDSETGEIAPVMHICFLMELVHRGMAIRKSLEARAAMRRRRRSANLRYRAPRFNNRPKAKGWLAPSLKHRVDTTCSWVGRLRRLAPITHLAQELVRFDMQLMQNSEISGVEYQQGTLQGYEVREYLLEKFRRTCAYCDTSGVPLQMEHIHPKANGGSNRVSNLTLACGPCNAKKAARDIKDFLVNDPVRLKRILAQAKAPLRDAATVNSTRWALFNALKTFIRPEARLKARSNRGCCQRTWQAPLCTNCMTQILIHLSGVLNNSRNRTQFPGLEVGWS